MGEKCPIPHLPARLHIRSSRADATEPFVSGLIKASRFHVTGGRGLNAYYLQYKYDGAAYVDKWWEVVNWDDVGKRFDKAKH